MKRRWSAWAAASWLAFAGLACANPGANPGDTVALSQSDLAIFVPLVCGGATPAPRLERTSFICHAVIGYPDQAKIASLMHGFPRRPGILVGFQTIIRGAITAPGRDEAYVSYGGDLESHAENLGGGILFRHQSGTWKMVKWYPGEHLDNCVALPDIAPVELVCLFEDSHAEDASMGISVVHAWPPLEDKPTLYRLSADLGVIRDNMADSCSAKIENAKHGWQEPIDPCGYWQKGHGFLLDIEDFKRSNLPGVLAQASIDYATPADIGRACHATCFLDVPRRHGNLQLIVNGYRIEARLPIDPQDYQWK
jgi:hypothetical protein